MRISRREFLKKNLILFLTVGVGLFTRSWFQEKTDKKKAVASNTSHHPARYQKPLAG